MQTDTIICGDAQNVLATFPDGCIDLTVTSPPYDDLRTYNGYSFEFEPIARQLYRVTKPGGVLVWVVGDATVNGSETGTSFKQALNFKEIGFNLHDTMVWHKPSSPLTHNRYEQEFEYMFVMAKGAPKTFNPVRIPKNWVDTRKDKTIRRERDGSFDMGHMSIKTDKIMGNVWLFQTGHGHGTADKYAFDHPATFPEKLAARHIGSWSNEGDTVLDPFNGSGTTTKMAYKLGRRYVGIEISPEYCEIAERRLKQQVLL